MKREVPETDLQAQNSFSCTCSQTKGKCILEFIQRKAISFDVGHLVVVRELTEKMLRLKCMFIMGLSHTRAPTDKDALFISVY